MWLFSVNKAEHSAKDRHVDTVVMVYLPYYYAQCSLLWNRSSVLWQHHFQRQTLFDSSNDVHEIYTESHEKENDTLYTYDYYGIGLWWCYISPL